MSTVPARPTLRDFEAVVGRVYAEDPSFVHPDVRLLGAILDGGAPTLRHATARAFAVPSEAFAVAFVDPRLQEKTGRAVGSIGFFEAVSEWPAGEVLGQACEWLASKGVTEIWAPFNGNPLFGVGLREDRFDEPPLLGCSHHPARYAALLEASGFSRAARYLDFEIDLTDGAWREPAAEVEGVTFRPASRARFREDIALFMRMHNEAFRDVWGEAEVSEEEAWHRMSRARMAFVPPLFLFAMQGGEEVGFVLCLPDLNEVVAPLRSRPTSPSGVWKMATRRRKVRSVALLSVGVKPSLHGRGIGTALVAQACAAARKLGYRRLEYALVAESNEASKSTVARFGGKLCRTFGVYAKDV